MSKIASKPVELSSDIKFNVTDNTVCIEGPKGKLEFVKSDDVTIVHTAVSYTHLTLPTNA